MGPYEAEQQQEDGRGSHPGETATEDGVMANGGGLSASSDGPGVGRRRRRTAWEFQARGTAAE